MKDYDKQQNYCNCTLGFNVWEGRSRPSVFNYWVGFNIWDGRSRPSVKAVMFQCLGESNSTLWKSCDILWCFKLWEGRIRPSVKALIFQCVGWSNPTLFIQLQSGFQVIVRPSKTFLYNKVSPDKLFLKTEEIFQNNFSCPIFSAFHIQPSVFVFLPSVFRMILCKQFYHKNLFLYLKSEIFQKKNFLAQFSSIHQENIFSG